MPARPLALPPEHELALLLAGTAAARERTRSRQLELLARADEVALEAFMLRLGMLALLGRRLEQAAGGALPTRLRKRVEAHALQAQRQGVGQELLTVRLLTALEEAGIRTLALKGPLLGERLYGDVAARISADVDVLVAPQDLPRAVEAMLALGYERQPHRVGDDARPALHERLVHPDGLPDVELHWRVHWYEERFSAELLAHAVPGPDGCLVPRRTDELAALLLIYARDGFAGLRLACDLGAWWDRHGDELGPQGLTATARAHPAIARALATAATLAERLVGLPAERVLASDVLAQASPQAARLVNWPLRGSPGQIDANVSLVDWLLAPRGQWRALARRNVLLGRQELLARWPDAHARAWAPLRLRALHAIRVVRRYGIASATVLRHGAWAPPPGGPGVG
jgi:hypothetical protein